MPSLEELRGRIDGTKDLQSVVRVMKSLSAVSIGHYQAASQSLRRYQEVVDRCLQVALGDVEHSSPQSTAHDGRPEHFGLVAMGSDRGLCGRFNEAIAERTLELARRCDDGAGPPPIIVIGTRLEARLDAAGLTPHQAFVQPGSVDGLGSTVDALLSVIDRLRSEPGISRAEIVYSTEARGGGTRVMTETLFPLDRELLSRIAARPWPTKQLPMTSGPPAGVRSSLIRERLFITLLRAGAESVAAEHAARLSAMQAAERNITEKLDELEADFRRERQNAITTELLDIVSAYEGLRSKS